MSDLLERIKKRRAQIGEPEAQGSLADRIAKRRLRLASAPQNTDGTYGQPPEGMEYDPVSGQMVDTVARRQFDERVLAARPVSSRAVEVVQGLPLAGEWLDEGVEALSPRAAENMRRMSGAMERINPVESAALNFGGGMMAAAPLAVAGGGAKAVDFVSRGANAVTRGARAGALAAPLGAAEGAAAFSGRAEPGQRLKAAASGAALGGGLAAAMGPLGSMIGEGASALAKRVKRLDVKTIADEFDISPASARVVKRALQNDDLATAQARLSALGDDAMLADAGDATAALLDASANTGGAALRTARSAVDARAGTMKTRMDGVLDALLGKPKGVKTAAREISSMTAAGRKKAYDLAYSKPIDYAGPGRAIEDVIARIPDRTLRAAIQEANDAMREAGVTNKQIMAQISDDGAVSFSTMPDVRQVDFLKRALDDISRKEVDQFGRPTAAGVRSRRLAGDLREALKLAVPEYGRALRIGGDKLQRDEALALGKSLLFKNTTIEDVRGFMNQGVSREAKGALRQGLREGIESTLSNVRRTITDDAIDAREAMQLVKELSSRANTAKVKQVLGTARANRLLQELDRAAAALQLRAAIATNSKTAIRQSIQDQVAEEAAPGLARQVAGRSGNVFEAAGDLTASVAGTDARSISAREKAVFDEIASALVNMRGQDAQRALGAVQRAMDGQPLKDAEAALIGRLVGISAPLLSQKSMQQSLAN